jgi:hypothetical protein
MSLPKKFKNNIEVYYGKELLPRRQEMLDEITKSDSYLPDTILHDDLDRGMLNYATEHFKVISGEKRIPVIPRILTVQRWAEIEQTWEYNDEDGNVNLPFISVVRKPDAQPGTNPSVQRTIPDRHRFHYSTVKTWNGGQLGANIYKIPQPIAVDISYDVTIVCQKFRDLNKFNKIVMERFCSRQDYVIIKGHYVPIIFERNEDNTPMESLDGRRFYVQNYHFTMLGFLIDGEEFEVKPAINRILLLTEIVDTKDFIKQTIFKTVCMEEAVFIAESGQTVFNVHEPIGVLFYVTVNGATQLLGTNFYHVQGTSFITFVSPPYSGDCTCAGCDVQCPPKVIIKYYKGRSTYMVDSNGRPIQLVEENFTYTGGSLSFTVEHIIDCVVTLDINGLVEEEGVGFEITGSKTITLLSAPVNPSSIGIRYLY